MSAEMPSWPKERPGHMGLANSTYWEQYERARANAAMARLKVAVEALERLSYGDHPAYAKEALSAIGPLPKD